MNPNDAETPLPVDTEAPTEAAPKRRRAPRRKPAETPTDAASATTGGAAGDPSPDGPATTGPVSPAPVAEVAAPEGPGETGNGAVPAAIAADGAEPPRKRGRNRRRGRRGGERGPRTAPVPGADDGAAPAEADDDDDEDDATPGDAVAEAVPAEPPADVGEVFAQVLSGAYDAEPEPAADAPAPAPKRVLAAEPDAPKLHKVLAQAGIGSRRDLEQMILEGRITVNGEPAHIGQRISFGDRISVGGKPVRFRIAPPPPRVLAYHKPAGEVVTHDDPQQRPTVFRRLPRLPQGKWQSVGRLDINTEGLLLFTNSGELANQLMHPRFGVEREYAVRSLGTLSEESRARLLEGVEIDGQRCAFKSIEDGGGEGANHWYRCVITEGRHREVRRLFEAVGHAVSRLIRIRYGSVVLPRGLKRGVWVDLGEHDVRALRRLTGTEPRAGEADRRGGNNRRGRRGRDRPVEAAARPPRGDAESGFIPNPLQQTYDKRAIQQERQQRREIPEDGPIPNPLQQTYDKRALQRERQPSREIPEDGPIPNPLQQTYDKRFAQKDRGAPGVAGGGGGRGRRGKKGGGGGGGENAGRQPDPLKTAVGYIGGDAFLRKGAGGPRGGRGGKRGGRGPR